MNIVFTPGVDFENLLSRAEFETVASRSAQAATLKAEKTGKSTVDLEAAKKKPTTDKEEGSGNTKPSDKGDNTQGGGSENGGENAGTDGGGTEAGSDGNMG